MIKTYDGQTLTPKRAAQMILSEVLDEGTAYWSDTHIGHDLDLVLTDRERRLIDDQVVKIWDRIDRRYLRP